MIKKILLTILFAFISFFMIDKVYALSVDRMYMGYNDSLLKIGSNYKFYSSGKRIDNDIWVSEQSSEPQVSYNTLYTRYAFCVEDKYGLDSSIGNTVSTNIRCTTQAMVSGYLTFITIGWDEQYLVDSTIATSTDVNTYHYKTSFSVSSFSDSTYATLYSVDVGRTLSDFPSYDTNSDVLNKLDTLNDSVVIEIAQLHNTNKEILYYILKIYESMTSCHDSVNLFDGNFESGYINISTGQNASLSSSIRTKNYIPIKPDTIYTFSSEISVDHWFLYYDENKNLISKFGVSSNRRTFTTPNNAHYLRWYLVGYTNTGVKEQLQLGSSSTVWEPYGEQICKSKLEETKDVINETNKKLDETNNFMKDDDTSGASGEANSFFSGFSTDTHGLTSIITAPLELIGNIVGSTCSPLQIPLPYVNTNLTLPCMGTIYKQHFGSLFSLYQLITFGYISYWVCVRIFALVKDFKNPDHDEIEVMDL